MEEIYAVVFVDARHYHVSHEGRIVKRTVYIDIGIDMEGHKDVRRKERKCEVLAFHSEQKKSWRRIHPDRMCGRADRIPPDRNPAVRHPSIPEYNKVCFL